MKEEEKKEIKLSLGTAVILIILIIILAIILSIKIVTKDKRINRNYEKNENSITDLSISDVIDILNKSKNITNYKCSYLIDDKLIDGKEVTETYKNNKSILESKNGNNKNFIYYIDYDNNKNDVAISKEDKIALKGYTLIKKDDVLKSRREELLQVLQNIEDTDLTVVGNDVYDNKNCIVIEIKQVYSNDGWAFAEELNKYNGKDMITKIWIDYETGAILKNVFKCEDQEYTFEYKYEFNCVTDEEVKLPDLTEYRVIEK